MVAGRRRLPAGTWQGASPDGEWSLVGTTTTAPPFDWAHFELGDRGELTRRYPEAADRIAELTRGP